MSGGRTESVIAGIARDAGGVRLPSLTVELIAVAQTVTDSIGAFRFPGLAPGTYFLRATRIGVRPVLKNITVAEGETVRVDVRLEPRAQELTAVVVRADSSTDRLADPSGFSQRLKNRQGGVFFTGDEIERRQIERTEQVFRGIPDVKVDTGGIVTAERGLMNLREILGQRSITDCFGMQVFVDGVMMPNPFNINTVMVQSIRGIELYRGSATTPIELRSAKTICGTIAIWTR